MTTTPPHGTNERWERPYSCRCRDCFLRRKSTNYRRRKYAQWRGEWESRYDKVADLEDVRKHMRWLMERGASSWVIAHYSGISHNTIRNYLYDGRHDRADRTQTAKIMELGEEIVWRPVPHLRRSRVLSVGTRRRSQALTWMGYPLAEQARRVGMHRETLRYSLTQRFVYPKVAVAMRDLFDQLVVRVPPERDAKEARLRRLARESARRRGWFGPGAWGNIDDPYEEPE